MNHTYQTGSSMSSSANIAQFVHHDCTSGVPQGSVLEPILFALYVGEIISTYGILHHRYADDTQLFFALKAATIDTDIHLLESCSQAVQGWFLDNDLMLNADKLEVMLVGSGAQLRKIDKHNLLKLLTSRFQL